MKPIFMQRLRVIIALFTLFSSTNFVSAAVVLPVPFTVQAPFGNWSSPWQDFCEEASVVMVAHYLWKLPLTPKFADAEMQLIKTYETYVFGRYKDTSAEETTQILRNLYGFKEARVLYDPRLADIKRELSGGNPLIVPVAGRLLGNPYFRPPGPLYHMLVIKGFDDAREVFITNDPGTRRGENLEYPQKKLFEAIHDWNGGDVTRGKRAMIVIGK
ncbi:MAG: C39 family peptidase [Candidatus Sungbacteria bacterium]|nr:C39 family peptidase [Candidatus Sungbacteria bacterium]